VKDGPNDSGKGREGKSTISFNRLLGHVQTKSEQGDKEKPRKRGGENIILFRLQGNERGLYPPWKSGRWIDGGKSAGVRREAA